jgi:UDP-glucose 4-epimerase
MTVAWVVGAGGLLGRALTNQLRQTGTRLFSPSPRLAWGEERLLPDQIAQGITAFAHHTRQAGAWELYWAAGITGMGSPEPMIAAELRALQSFLEAVVGEPTLREIPGRFLLSSSAGGIYADTSQTVVDETSPTAPTTPYAWGKLRQEQLVRQSLLPSLGCRVLLARISTLYGPAHPGDTRQGLITTIARGMVRNQPVPIFVPLDTIRDYLDSQDAARIGLASLRSLPVGADPTLKIIASERPTTVAEIVATFRRVAHRRLLFTTGVGEHSGLYARRFRFHSRVFPELGRLAQTTLLHGVARVLAAERQLQQRPAPPHTPTTGR